MKRTDSAILSEVPELKRRLARRTAKDLIGDKLIALIVSGVIAEGDELPSERQLAEALSVSRETIRGAVQILSAKGIVDVAHGVRTRIARVDFDRLEAGIAQPDAINRYDLESVHSARLLIEMQVVGDAAERIDAASLERLDASLAAQREAMDDPVRFLICDREFHVTVYRACGNPLLADFVSDLYAYMMEHRRLAVARPGAIQKSYEDHLAIVAALAAHDREQTLVAFGHHIDRIYQTTRSVLQGEKGRRPARRLKAVS